MSFSNYIQSLLKHQALPVLISNSCESFKQCIADITAQRIGIINISQRLDLTNGISFVPMQCYSSLLSEKVNVEMLSIGVYEGNMSNDEAKLAASMGVQWIKSADFSSIQVKRTCRELENFLFRHESIALNIDLRTIVRGMTIHPPFALELDTLLFTCQKIMKSGKVIMVNLTGDTESLIFSSEVKKVLDVIRTKQEEIHYTA